MNDRRRSPAFFHWLLARMAAYETHHSAIGDFEETFRRIAAQRGPNPARRWYIAQVLRSLPGYVRLILSQGVSLAANYLKSGLRNLRRRKLYAFINITGLAVGLTAAFLILLFIRFELSFDRHHANAGRIHRLVCEDFAGTPYPLADTLRDTFPGIENVVRLRSGIAERPVTFTARGRTFQEVGLLMADPSFFDIFSYDFLYGDPATALSHSHAIVLTETAARRYFGRPDSLGETLIQGGDLLFQVTAVVADPPPAAHFNFQAVIPPDHAARFNGGSDDRQSWTSFNYRTYLLLHPEGSTRNITKTATKILSRRRDEPRPLLLQRLTDIHLHSHLRGELAANGDVRTLRVYGAVGLLILILACVNFMNLGAAQSINRGGEVGLRKVLGARRSQIVKQFIGEAVAIAWLAGLAAVILAQLTIPIFSRLTARELSWAGAQWQMLVPALLLITSITGVAAGSYPALFASAFQPDRTLRGTPRLRSHRFPLRNLLVGLQFLASVAFIGCTLVILGQMRLLRSHHPGYEREQIITVRLSDEVLGQAIAIKDELRRHPSVLMTSAANLRPSGTISNIAFDWDGRLEEKRAFLNVIRADHDFLDTFGIKLIQGRTFQAGNPIGAAYIVNRRAALLIGGDVIGKTIKMFSGSARPGRIVGVVDDFNFRSLHHSVEPLAVFLDGVRRIESGGRSYRHTPFRYVSVRAAPENLKAALDHVRDVCRRFIPSDPECWFFFDEEFGRMYRAERRTADMMLVLSIVAVSLAGMGLLGLSLSTVQNRRKEIGIRRVMGASIREVLILFFRDFIRIHGAALLIGFPLIHMTMTRWLSGFAYRIPIGPWIYIVTAVTTAALFFAAAGAFVLRAAAADPVESLKHE